MSGFFANGARPVETKLYDLLGVKPNASDAEIKQSYKWLAKKFHPDKNSEDGDKFKEITHAYGILSDLEQRRRYDTEGLEGIKRGTAGGRPYAEKPGAASGGSRGASGGDGDASAAGGFGGQFRFGAAFGGYYFSAYGGGGGGYGAASGGQFSPGSGFGGLFRGMDTGGFEGSGPRPKGQNTLYTLRVTPEELYNGKTSKLRISKNVICSGCRGVGGLSQVCRTCNGEGSKFHNPCIGPFGMVLEPCSNCNSKGTVMAEKCKNCNGNKTIKATKIVEVKVKPGMRDGQIITLHGEGNQEPGIEPGNVVIVLKQKQHETFPSNPASSPFANINRNGEDGVSSDSVPNRPQDIDGAKESSLKDRRKSDRKSKRSSSDAVTNGGVAKKKSPKKSSKPASGGISFDLIKPLDKGFKREIVFRKVGDRSDVYYYGPTSDSCAKPTKMRSRVEVRSFLQINKIKDLSAEEHFIFNGGRRTNHKNESIRSTPKTAAKKPAAQAKPTKAKK